MAYFLPVAFYSQLILYQYLEVGQKPAHAATLKKKKTCKSKNVLIEKVACKRN